MSFLDLVTQSVSKANSSKHILIKIDVVFEKINSDLKNFEPGELKLERASSTLSQAANLLKKLNRIESEYFQEDVLQLSLTRKNKTASEVAAGWKQHVEGFPCTLKFAGQELICSNEIQLISGISELLSSIAFGNAVNNLIARLGSA